MKKHKKINKVKVAITIFIIVLLISMSVFGRYIYNTTREAYFTSKKFYFTSNLLTLDNQKYTYELDPVSTGNDFLKISLGEYLLYIPAEVYNER